MARARSMKDSFITMTPSPFMIFHLFSISPFTSLLYSPKKSPRNQQKLFNPQTLALFFLSLLVTFSFLGISILNLIQTYQDDQVTCSLISATPTFSLSAHSAMLLASLSSTKSNDDVDEPRLAVSAMMPLPTHILAGNLTEEERKFWEQPDGEGYKPCLDFRIRYRRKSAKISKEKKRFLVVVASGGLNQQRNQIVDAVVIARILEAALVVPVLQVNLIWGDER